MRITFSEAIHHVKNGQVIAVPTETVYGLAASLKHLEAIEKIFSLKGRPLQNPLIIHVADIAQVASYARALPPYFKELAQAFWPGPLTVVVPIDPSLIFPQVRAGLETAGFRIPAHPLTLQLLRETGPLVMPSANLSGKPSATHSDHVEEDFGPLFPVLEGGVCQKGLESTILYYQQNRWGIVRLGALSPESFQHVLGYQPQLIHKTSSSTPICPGQLFRHYAPEAKLILEGPVAASPAPYVLGFKERCYPADKRVLYMGSLFNAAEVAESLYQLLRQLDQEGARLAWVDMDFPKQGLWMTIAERLQRAGE